MRWVKIWLIGLSFICSGWLAGGLIKTAGAAIEEKALSAAEVGGMGGQEKPTEADQEKGKEGANGEEECPATFGPIITDTAVPIEKGQFAVQPTFGLSFVTDSLTQSWRRVSAGGNFKSFGMEWKFTYGLINNLEVFVVVPFFHNWVTNFGPQGQEAHFSGLGDFNLTLKYRLVEETKTLPTVTALFATDFPTGHYQCLNPTRLGVDEIGGGAYVFTVGLNLSKYVKPIILYGTFWYSMGTAFSGQEEDDEGNPTFMRNYPRDVVTVNLAAEYILSEKWVALLELTSSFDGGRLIGHKANVAPSALISVLPGIEYMATEKLAFALGVNVDLAGKNTDAAVTPMFSLVYAF